jgi:hypothetical protein
VLASFALGVEAIPIFLSRHFLWSILFVGAKSAASAGG